MLIPSLDKNCNKHQESEKKKNQFISSWYCKFFRAQKCIQTEKKAHHWHSMTFYDWLIVIWVLHETHGVKPGEIHCLFCTVSIILEGNSDFVIQLFVKWLHNKWWKICLVLCLDDRILRMIRRSNELWRNYQMLDSVDRAGNVLCICVT